MKNITESTQTFINLLFKDAVHPIGDKYEPLKVDGAIGDKTRYGIKRAQNHLKAVYTDKKHQWSDTLNILAIRVDNAFTDYATDWFIVVTPTNLYAMPCSTKAGRYWVQNPITYGGITGTAVLECGQYMDAWQFKTANNWRTLWLETPYFMQVLNVTVLRDGNRDNNVDLTMPRQTGLFGINIHTSGWTYFIWNWSAGCIVIPRGFWVELLSLNLFTLDQKYTFTLFNNADVFNR